MAGPHPVVGVAAEFADIARGSAHKAYIGEDLVDIHEVLVAVVEGLDNGFVVCAGHGFDGEDGDVLLDDALAFGLGGLVVDAFKHTVGHIFHSHKTGCGESFAGYLLTAVHCPESMGEVVVLDGAVAGDVVVAAVVVGEEEALVGDKLAGASLVEKDDGVFEAGVVDVVDVFSGDMHACFLHGSLVLAQKHGNPHALVGHSRGQQKHNHCEKGKDFFHKVKS